MAEYIERKAAYPLAKKMCEAIDSEDFQRLNFGMRILDWIDDIPAADAIEELSTPRWIPFETRPMDEEERQYYSKQYGFGLTDDEAVIYCSDMPDQGQEVLVCNEYGMIWIDTFDDDPDYGVGFETNGDMDGLVAWMPLPKPYETPKEGE